MVAAGELYSSPGSPLSGNVHGTVSVSAHCHGQRHADPAYALDETQLAAPTLARIGPVGLFVSCRAFRAVCLGRAPLTGGLQRPAEFDRRHVRYSGFRPAEGRTFDAA